MAISPDLQAQILRYHLAEKWRPGTICRQLGVHYDTVQRVLAQHGVPRAARVQRTSRIEPYLPFIQDTLDRFPKLTAARLYAMVSQRGYVGSTSHFRHLITTVRPRAPAEAFLRLRTLPGEQGQVDWGHFGTLTIGRAVRPLMAFVMVLSYSRRIFLRFYLDARMENFLRGHLLSSAKLGRYKSLVDFDWTWPKQCDRAAIDALLRLDFMQEAGNAVLIGPNGVGKSTIARNIAHQAVIAGYTVLFTTAAAMLGDLAAQDGDLALKRRLNHYVRPQLLLIDEVGYLSYSNRHADLLFEIVSRRYEYKSTVVTTNRPFAEWGQVFPNAPCVVSLIDRLIHHAEIVPIEGESYRLKQPRERAQQRNNVNPTAALKPTAKRPAKTP